jgi:hypothetical protein
MLLILEQQVVQQVNGPANALPGVVRLAPHALAFGVNVIPVNGYAHAPFKLGVYGVYLAQTLGSNFNRNYLSGHSRFCCIHNASFFTKNTTFFNIHNYIPVVYTIKHPLSIIPILWNMGGGNPTSQTFAGCSFRAYGCANT